VGRDRRMWKIYISVSLHEDTWVHARERPPSGGSCRWEGSDGLPGRPSGQHGRGTRQMCIEMAVPGVGWSGFGVGVVGTGRSVANFTKSAWSDKTGTIRRPTLYGKMAHPGTTPYKFVPPQLISCTGTLACNFSAQRPSEDLCEGDGHLLQSSRRLGSRWSACPSAALHTSSLPDRGSLVADGDTLPGVGALQTGGLPPMGWGLPPRSCPPRPWPKSGSVFGARH